MQIHNKVYERSLPLNICYPKGKNKPISYLILVAMFTSAKRKTYEAKYVFGHTGSRPHSSRIQAQGISCLG